MTTRSLHRATGTSSSCLNIADDITCSRWTVFSKPAGGTLLQESAEAAAAPAADDSAVDNSGRPSASREASNTATASSLSAAVPNGALPASEGESEVARFGAAKERKHVLEAGIAHFNGCVCSRSQPALHAPAPCAHAHAFIMGNCVR